MPTRLELRNYIADSLGDLFEGALDIPAVGAAGYTTVNDSLLTQRDEWYWADADIVLAYEGGTYDQRRVTSYVPTISGLTGGCIRVDGTLSLVPSTGTNYYLYRTFKVDSYNRAINRAILRAGELGLNEVRHTNESLVATTRVWEYSVPSSSLIERITDVYWLDSDNYNEPKRLGPRTWDWSRESNATKLQLWSDSLVTAGETLRVEGLGPPSTLSTDGASLDEDVPVDFVVQWAAGELKLSKWKATDPDDSAREGTYLKTQAEDTLRRSPRNRISRGRVYRRW